MTTPLVPPASEAVAVRAALLADLDTGFVELVAAYQGVVHAVAAGLRDRSSDAEDLAAEAFLRAYRALRTFDDERIATLQPRPWLLAILRNIARNAARDAARRPSGPVADEPPDPPSAEPSVEERAEQMIERECLRALLERLPEAQRAAVVLRYVVDLPHQEIGQVLGCTETTARSHVARGLRQLRALLAEQHGAAAKGMRRCVS